MPSSYPPPSPQRGYFSGHHDNTQINHSQSQSESHPSQWAQSQQQQQQYGGKHPSHSHPHNHPQGQYPQYNAIQTLHQGKYPPVQVQVQVPSQASHRSPPTHPHSQMRYPRGMSPFLSSVMEARIQSWRECSANPLPAPSSPDPTTTSRSSDDKSGDIRKTTPPRMVRKQTPKVPAPKTKSAPASISTSTLARHPSAVHRSGIGMGMSMTPLKSSSSRSSRDHECERERNVDGGLQLEETEKLPSRTRSHHPSAAGAGVAGSVSQCTSCSSRCDACGGQRPAKSVKSCSCECSCEYANAERHNQDRRDSGGYQAGRISNKSGGEEKQATGMRSYYSRSSQTHHRDTPSRSITPVITPRPHQQSTSAPAPAATHVRPEETQAQAQAQAGPYLAPTPMTMAEQVAAYKAGDIGEGPLVQYGDDPSVPMPERKRAMPPDNAVKEPPRIAGSRDPISQNYWRQMFPPVGGPTGINPGVSAPIPMMPMMHPPQMFGGMGMYPWSC